MGDKVTSTLRVKFLLFVQRFLTTKDTKIHEGFFGFSFVFL
jgi:hypothetical protein